MIKLVRWRGRRRWVAVNLQFEPRDLWIGAFWQRKTAPLGATITHVYVCVVPLLPLHVTVYRFTIEAAAAKLADLSE